MQIKKDTKTKGQAFNMNINKNTSMSRNLLPHFHFPLFSDTLGNTDAGINNT